MTAIYRKDIPLYRKRNAQFEVRKGKSCGNLPARNSTAAIGVFWCHGLYDSPDLLFTDEEEQMKRNRLGDSSTHFLVPRTKELVFSFNRTLHLEVNKVMVEHKCPKSGSWNEARCKQLEFHYTEVKCLWCGTEARKANLLFTDEEEQMKGNRRRTDEAAPTEQTKNRKKYEEQVKNAEEMINRSKSTQ
ncbi:hypothetical protein LOTGIDRAFT_175716 [Lottia gigantea]|uniref:Uncharacterized protein n=1 Tax=Lottia gigantea TaxID=225164 RepID=V4A6D0_LOTGI|nr:hypothetical protein LOTGIDRAFT_175716 [Lottia gigantea]ESO92282.1 hypothetical protein LOTGIDRAFT_175716 [Lottia gigantea]